MNERGDLEAAAAAGVIGAEHVNPLYEFLQARRALPSRAAPSGEEDLRFIRNFHDVFLAIGILLFSCGLAVAIGTYVAGLGDPVAVTVTTGALASVSAALMWGLGEVFARRRRLFLPSIAIVIALTCFAVVAAATLYAGLVLGRDFEPSPNLQSLPPELKLGILVAAAFAIIAPAVFYARFRLPFSLGLTGAGAAMFVIVLGFVVNADMTMQMLPALYLVLGLLLFLAGVAFDARDPGRTTRLSDNGFWLHFAAAPLILNGAFGLVGMLVAGKTAMGGAAGMLANAESGAAALQAAITLLIVLLLGLVSLLINRRALIVSALLTTGVAIGVLMNAVGLGAGALVAATLITLGAFVLILGAGWHAVRRALLGWVRPGGMWARVFPPEAPAAA